MDPGLVERLERRRVLTGQLFQRCPVDEAEQRVLAAAEQILRLGLDGGTVLGIRRGGKTYDGREKSLLRGATRDVLPKSVIQRVKSPSTQPVMPHMRCLRCFQDVTPLITYISRCGA